MVLNSGSGGSTLATDEAGVALRHYQLIKLVDGTADSEARIAGDATNGLDVDVTRLPAIPSGTNNIGDVDVLTVPAPLNLTGGGVEASALRVTLANDSTGVVSVDDNGGSLTVDVGTALPAGTNNIGDVDVLSIAAGDNNIGNVDVVTLPNVTLAAGTNTNEVVGDVAHDAVVAGNPVLVAASSETMADSAPANRVSADGDASRLSVTDGALFVIPTGPQTWSYHENSSSALTDTTVHAAPGAGLSLYVTDIVCSTGAATALNIFFEEGTTTTVLGPWYLEAVAGRGLAIHFGTPKKITANTALTVTTSAAIAHSIDVTGFIAPG